MCSVFCYHMIATSGVRKKCWLSLHIPLVDDLEWHWTMSSLVIA